MTDNDGPGAWPIWTPGSRLAELEFMHMNHYAPNRCEPSIEALNFGYGEVKCENSKKKIGGGGVGSGRGGGSG